MGLFSIAIGLVLAAGDMWAAVGELLMYVMVVLGAMGIHGLLTLPMLYLALARKNLGPLLRHLLYPLAFAMGTASR